MSHEDFLFADRISVPNRARSDANSFVIAVADTIRVSSCDDHAVGFRIICAKGSH